MIPKSWKFTEGLNLMVEAGNLLLFGKYTKLQLRLTQHCQTWLVSQSVGYPDMEKGIKSTYVCMYRKITQSKLIGNHNTYLLLGIE